MSSAAAAANRAQPEAAPAPPCTMAIFGARGDLVKRLLAPALYNLAHAGRLNDGFKVLGIDRAAGDDAGFADGLGDFLHELADETDSEFGHAKIDAKSWQWLAGRIAYQSAGLDRRRRGEGKRGAI